MASSREYLGNLRAPEFPPDLEWLNTGGRRLSLAALRGKLVLLDFWTYGCINCLHIIPDLERLEAEFADALVVIGVHAAKFENEGRLDNLRRIIERYDLHHPVVNDREMRVWQDYVVRAWPTTVLIDPRGRVLAAHSGEGVYAAYRDLVAEAVARYAASGLLDRTPLALLPEAPLAADTGLRYPGKVLADPDGGRLFIADTGNHRLVIASVDGEVRDVVGSGERGLEDGPYEQARLASPQGMALDGGYLYLADTDNHALRRIDLAARRVETVAGDGTLAHPRRAGTDAGHIRLNSPWDLVRVGRRLFIAMAGSHQLWLLDLDSGELGPYAGSGREALHDGTLTRAALAQPSGLATDGQWLYVADSEASAVRRVGLGPDARVETLVGQGLFAFGDVDGPWERARLQHPLGVAWAAGALFVADTYNHRLKRLDLTRRQVVSWAGTGRPGHADGDAAAFYEPGGVAAGEGVLYVADTNNHAIRVVSLTDGRVETLPLRDPRGLLPRPAPTPGNVARLPAQRVQPGQGRVCVALALPEGYAVNAHARSTVRLSAVEGTAVSLRAEAAPIIAERAEALLEATFAEGRALLGGEITLFYCRADGQGLCHLYQRGLVLEVEVSRDAPGNEIRLRLPVLSC